MTSDARRPSPARRGAARRIAAGMALGVAVGCVTPREYPPPPNVPPSARLIEVDEVRKPASGGVVPTSAFEPAAAPRRPRHALVLSGGGMYGAYSAGVLKGWAEAGSRPEFDVVTGVSTGSLVGLYAFLGPDWDRRLEEVYTTAGPNDIYRRRALPLAVFGDALADSDPLRKKIEAEVTPELLQLVAARHAEGRRLYVGTTNLDTKRLVVWDMGAIAAGGPGKVRLFRDVLLASCSVPGLLPPVPIDVEIDGKRHTELHVDGGVTASAFLRPAMLGADGPDAVAQLGETTAADRPQVHVIVAGKLRPGSTGPVKRRLLDVSGESMRAVLQARWEGDLLRLFVVSRQAGADARVSAVPDEIPVASDAMTFDPAVMRTLMSHGVRAAADGTAWRPLTASLLASVSDPPRSDVRFVIDRESPPEE